MFLIQSKLKFSYSKIVIFSIEKVHQRIAKMLLRMVMFLEVSLPMVRNVLVNSTKKMGTMILRLRVKVRLNI